MYYDKPITACYGCQACSEVCPVNAISMNADEEGFLFPHIDTDKCIECNQCERSCPTQSSVVSKLFHTIPKLVDAAWEKELTERLESTSGGAFYAIARQWVLDGGVVYGADFNEQLIVSHVRVDNIESLKRLRGSKYVQSDTFGSFRSAKRDLQTGKKVLFSGTPCQIAGLRAFLKKEYDNLLTIDLVCHGVPSPMILKEHLSYIQNSRKDKLVDFKFRGKEKSGWRSYVKYIFFSKKKENHTWGNDFYAYSFNRARFNRRSCFSCDFSQSSRVGDITLSDFWNAEKHCKQLKIERKYGFNLIMCNTPKGQKAYENVLNELRHITLPVEIAIEGDVRLRQTEEAPSERDTIFKDVERHGYQWAVLNRMGKRSRSSRLMPTFLKNLIYEIKARI